MSSSNVSFESMQIAYKCKKTGSESFLNIHTQVHLSQTGNVTQNHELALVFGSGLHASDN